MSEGYLNSRTRFTDLNQDLVFILKMYSLDLVLSLIINYSFAFFIEGYSNDSAQNFFEPWGITKTLVIIVIFFPFWETILLQFIPIWLLKKITSKNAIIITVVASLFVLPHIPHFDYYLEALLIVPGAIILAWSFLKYYDTSILKAILITMLIHSMFNFTVSMLIYFQY